MLLIISGRIKRHFSYNWMLSAGLTLFALGIVPAQMALAGHNYTVAGLELSQSGKANSVPSHRFEGLSKAIDTAMTAGNPREALRLSRQMLTMIRAEYGDERRLTDQEFEQAYRITSSHGYSLIKKLHVAQQSEIKAMLALGDYGEAVQRFRRDLYLDMILFGDASPYYLNELNKYALMAKVAGERQLAVDWLTEAVRISKKMFGRRSKEQADALTILATLWYDLGKSETAIAYASQSMTMYQDLGVHSGHNYREALSTLALAEVQSGNVNAAEQLTLEIIEDLKTQGLTKSLEYGVYLGRIADYLEMRQDYETAEKFYNAAIRNTLFTEDEDSIVYALRVKALADMYHKTGQHQLADTYYRRVVGTLQKAGMTHTFGGSPMHDHVRDYNMLGQTASERQAEFAETGGDGFLNQIEDLIADE